MYQVWQIINSPSAFCEGLLIHKLFMNKTATGFVICISVIAFLAGMFFYLESDMTWLKYLQIPAIIFGAGFILLLNIPKLQRSMYEKQKGSKGDLRKLKSIFITPDEKILLDAGYRTVIRGVSFFSMPYLVTKVVVTNERVQILLMPPLTAGPSISLFFKKDSEAALPMQSSIISALRSFQYITEYRINEKSVKFITEHSMSYTIFMKPVQLKIMESIIKDNFSTQVVPDKS